MIQILVSAVGARKLLSSKVEYAVFVENGLRGVAVTRAFVAGRSFIFHSVGMAFKWS